jgi:hypothetical protein
MVHWLMKSPPRVNNPSSKIPLRGCSSPSVRVPALVPALLGLLSIAKDQGLFTLAQPYAPELGLGDHGSAGDVR